MAFGIDLIIDEYPEQTTPDNIITIKWHLRVDLSYDLPVVTVRFVDLNSYSVLAYTTLSLPSGIYDTPIYETQVYVNGEDLDILVEVYVEDRSIDWVRKYDQKTFKIKVVKYYY